MQKIKLYILFISFLIILNSCGSISEGMTGSKRSKSSDEFLVHKKKPLVVPPDFENMPSPKKTESNKKTLSTSNTSIEDLLNIGKKVEDNSLDGNNNKSLEQSILKKIKNN